MSKKLVQPKTVREKINAGYYDNKLPYVIATKSFTENQAYNKESWRLGEQFELDLATEHGVLKHPKRKLLYMKAYEAGHSSGYSEIEICYVDMVDLIK